MILVRVLDSFDAEEGAAERVFAGIFNTLKSGGALGIEQHRAASTGLQDPLAELVKIDPKSIGVGQYQHDVSQPALKKSLDFVVDICVNSVGVNLNTASYHLLEHVSGIGPSMARKIVEHRSAIGLFKSRQQLLDIPRFSKKTFEQAAGFLRIPNGEHPLDNTGVHPERYPALESLAALCKRRALTLISCVALWLLVIALADPSALAGQAEHFAYRVGLYGCVLALAGLAQEVFAVPQKSSRSVRGRRRASSLYSAGPASPGISTSSSTRSGRASRTRARPAGPSGATCTRQPSRARLSETTSARCASSSTSTSRSLLTGGPSPAGAGAR